jgi:hypothetical protein
MNSINQTIVSYVIIEIYEKWIQYTIEDPHSFLCNQYSKLRTAIIDGTLDTNPQEFMLRVGQITAYENMILEYKCTEARAAKEASKEEKEEKKIAEVTDQCDDYFIPHEDDERSNSDLAEEIDCFDPDAVNHWVDLLLT